MLHICQKLLLLVMSAQPLCHPNLAAWSTSSHFLCGGIEPAKHACVYLPIYILHNIFACVYVQPLSLKEHVTESQRGVFQDAAADINPITTHALPLDVRKLETLELDADSVGLPRVVGIADPVLAISIVLF